MIKMKAKEIIFSPTGGTKKVADLLIRECQLESKEIDLTDAAEKFESISVGKDEVAFIAVPSYGGRVPGLAAKRLRRICGNGAKCILVCVYGNRAYEDTLAELFDLAKECGFNTVAAVAAVAEHSILHQFAAGRPDRADEEELKVFANQIRKKLQEDGGEMESEVPGNRPYKESKPIPMVPKAGEDCDACGICARQCPAQAISFEDLKNADEKKCISCMRCVSVCHTGARKINAAAAAAVAQKIEKVCSVRKRNELYC